MKKTQIEFCHTVRLVTVLDSAMNKKLSCRRGTARRSKSVETCQLLHNCAKNRILKGLYYVHDLDGHSSRILAIR